MDSRPSRLHSVVPTDRAVVTMTTYGSRFYDDQIGGSRQSADVIVPIILQLTRARSVVDVGCGVGSWLRAYSRAGVADYLPRNGDWVGMPRAKGREPAAWAPSH